MNDLHNKTLDYYNKNAPEFITSTVTVDFTQTQDHFLKLLAQASRILDFGCGSGRDTKYFLSKGYRVDAIDGSEKLVEAASNYTGIEVRRMLFQELDEVSKYDGIWACSSILHLSKEELADVFGRMSAALKPEGIVYTSFKYGEFEDWRSGRYFTDFTEETFVEFVKNIRTLDVEEYWITNDVRQDKGEEKWLNLILRKREVI
ncbi:MAG: class I SAM-dependent methyltransferase [Eubacteriales bacterium]|nr:class I SAM-dependent methyltransferase [Eubacteriales bacterium]